ncbi:related to methyltransferase [Cephalotrichum gorgonifer]|uniref:Related to methyltransferase n=1 Tax=Cephalotrichum gorgonifer TaxID=2041049 RepID=A0AAE8SSY3_9PEZI|nr:related to methyltransferase [Cephalotrichum gorgonifer]
MRNEVLPTWSPRCEAAERRTPFTGNRKHAGGVARLLLSTPGGARPDSGTSNNHATIETHSLTESIREHVIEGGFRYHAYHAGKYPFPNGEVEQACDAMSHLLTLALCDGKAFFAPVHDLLTEGAEVLDLVADEYPASSFLGLDLSPIQPDYVPPNVQFVVDDIEHENGWDYPENHFDYIHIRHVLGSIKDPRGLIERAFRHLKPGGYLEIQEFHVKAHCDDDSLPDSVPYRLNDFYSHLERGLAVLGSDLHAVLSAPDYLADAGFSPTGHEIFRCPIGSWPRLARLSYCGDLLRTVIHDSLGGLARKPFVCGLGWTSMQVEMLLVEVRRAIADKSIHTYMPLHVMYGRKPPE